MPKKCFIKISGDMLENYKILNWIKELNKKYFVVVCVGGGTQINEAFAEAGFPVREFGSLGRETFSLQEKQLARDILEKNKAKLQNYLAVMGVYVAVVIPVIEIGTVLCHVNGDEFILTAYHGFDILYLVSTEDRLKEKTRQFAPYKKIKVKVF